MFCIKRNYSILQEISGRYRYQVEKLHRKSERYILSVMKLANFVTKLQDVIRPKQDEAEIRYIRKGKRIAVPAKDVERLYQLQRKRVVRVTYTGPKKLTCRNCGTPFYHFQTAGVAIRNTIPMRVSRKRIGRERKHRQSLKIKGLFDTCS